MSSLQDLYDPLRRGLNIPNHLIPNIMAQKLLFLPFALFFSIFTGNKSDLLALAMSSPNNLHDKLFKVAFSEKELVIDFINNFLPKQIQEKIDTNSLSLQPNSYITPSLKEFYSDIVYSAKFGKGEIELCLLFEHKSYVPPYPHLQILRYLVEAWFQMIVQGKKGGSLKLKPIIPMIIYHGADTWHHKRFESYFSEMDPVLKAFFPSFDYLLTDLGTFSDEELSEKPLGILHQALLLLKHTRYQKDIKSFFLKIFSSLEPYSEPNQYTELIKSYSVYICGVGGIEREIFINLVGQLPSNINKRVMTIYEEFIKEGEKRGEKRGIEIAKKAQQNQVITEGFENGLSMELIAKLLRLSTKEVELRMVELGLEK